MAGGENGNEHLRDPRERRHHQRQRREQHQPLVHRGPGAVDDAGTGEAGEQDDVGQRKNEEHRLVAPWRAATGSRAVDRDGDAKNEHGDRENRADGARGPMDVAPPGGDQPGLRAVQQHPCGEHRAMDVNDKIERRGRNEGSEIIGRRKAEDRRREHCRRGGAEKDALVVLNRTCRQRRRRHSRPPT